MKLNSFHEKKKKKRDRLCYFNQSIIESFNDVITNAVIAFVIDDH